MKSYVYTSFDASEEVRRAMFATASIKARLDDWGDEENPIFLRISAMLGTAIIALERAEKALESSRENNEGASA